MRTKRYESNTAAGEDGVMETTAQALETMFFF